MEHIKSSKEVPALLSLFSGIGAFEKGLENLGIEYKLLGYCENDKFASKAYAAIHKVDESLNLGDVCNSEEWNFSSAPTLLTYGFPCQDISRCWTQKGFEGDKSSLFFEAIKVIERWRPKVCICENVKELTEKKFEKEFDIVLESLEALGYKNYWKVLNVQDFGIPQNRERVFIVSVLKKYNKEFKWPKEILLEKRLKDYLSGGKEVSEKMLEKITWETKVGDKGIIQVADLHKGGQRGRVLSPEGICSCLTSTDYKQPKMVYENGIVRRLSTLECFKLMGFDEEDWEKVKSVGVSDSQMYKQAGNSIGVNVCEAIFEELRKRGYI